MIGSQFCRNQCERRIYGELCGQFGARIADIVAEVTDTKFLGKQSREHEYFDWPKAVVDQIRSANPGLAERGGEKSK